MADHRYRRVQPRMWADEKIQRLSWPPPGGLALFQYLMTGRETVALPGALDITESGLAERLRWSVEGLREAFAEVFMEGLAMADWKAGMVWLPGGPKNNKPQSPNVVKHWGKAFVELPECELKTQVYQDVMDYVSTLGKGYLKAFHEAFPISFAKPVAVAVAVAGTEAVEVAGWWGPPPNTMFPTPGPTLSEQAAEIYREVTGNTDVGEISPSWTLRQRDAIDGMRKWAGNDMDKLRSELNMLIADPWLASQPIHVVSGRVGTGEKVKGTRKASGGRNVPRVSDFSDIDETDPFADVAR